YPGSKSRSLQNLSLRRDEHAFEHPQPATAQTKTHAPAFAFCHMPEAKTVANFSMMADRHSPGAATSQYPAPCT
ncbi:TPA: hypothetical protein ACLEW1_006571, partial [Pseudomonas aeruginosa]